jgi:hypothetical protein
MFESNFPPDRLSVKYHVIWNAYKQMVAGSSQSEKAALFFTTRRCARTEFYGRPSSHSPQKRGLQRGSGCR